jgi:hypothetical protein
LDHSFSAKYPDRQIIVLGDRGTTKAGIRGAHDLAAHLRTALGREVSWALPAGKYKDVREQIVAGQWHRGLEIGHEGSLGEKNNA